MSEDERTEVKRLRHEEKILRMEKRDFKKSERILCKGNEVRFAFTRAESHHYPTRALCRVLQVSTSAYYAWKTRPGKLIDADTLRLSCENTLYTTSWQLR